MSAFVRQCIAAAGELLSMCLPEREYRMYRAARVRRFAERNFDSIVCLPLPHRRKALDHYFKNFDVMLHNICRSEGMSVDEFRKWDRENDLTFGVDTGAHPTSPLRYAEIAQKRLAEEAPR